MNLWQAREVVDFPLPSFAWTLEGIPWNLLGGAVAASSAYRDPCDSGVGVPLFWRDGAGGHARVLLFPMNLRRTIFPRTTP